MHHVLARDFFLLRLRAPAFAPEFAFDEFPPGLDGIGHSVAEVEIAAEALAVRTNERKYGPRVIDVDLVSQLPGPGESVDIEVCQFNRQ